MEGISQIKHTEPDYYAELPPQRYVSYYSCVFVMFQLMVVGARGLRGQSARPRVEAVPGAGHASAIVPGPSMEAGGARESLWTARPVTNRTAPSVCHRLCQHHHPNHHNFR